MALRKFDRAQCLRALNVEGLQVTVRKALIARHDRLIREATVMVIEFQDHGQDFLHWNLDKRGYVIESAQGWIWLGSRVTNMRELAPGSIVSFVRKRDEGTHTIKYPLTKVTHTGKGKA